MMTSNAPYIVIKYGEEIDERLLFNDTHIIPRESSYQKKQFIVFYNKNSDNFSERLISQGSMPEKS